MYMPPALNPVIRSTKALGLSAAVGLCLVMPAWSASDQTTRPEPEVEPLQKLIPDAQAQQRGHTKKTDQGASTNAPVITHASESSGDIATFGVSDTTQSRESVSATDNNRADQLRAAFTEQSSTAAKTDPETTSSSSSRSSEPRTQSQSGSQSSAQQPIEIAGVEAGSAGEQSALADKQATKQIEKQLDALTQLLDSRLSVIDTQVATMSDDMDTRFDGVSAQLDKVLAKLKKLSNKACGCTEPNGDNKVSRHQPTTSDTNSDSNEEALAHAKQMASNAQYTVVDVLIRPKDNDEAVAILKLAGDGQPDVRYIESAGKSWTSSGNWVALDLYSTRSGSDLPNGAGIITDVDYGQHDTYSRYVFYTASGTNLLVDGYEVDPGVVRIWLNRNGEVAASSGNAGIPVTDTGSDYAAGHWVVRAISEGAAVLYSAEQNELMSVQPGSAIPQAGFVTHIEPDERRVYTTEGVIKPYYQ